MVAGLEGGGFVGGEGCAEGGQEVADDGAVDSDLEAAEGCFMAEAGAASGKSERYARMDEAEEGDSVHHFLFRNQRG